MKRSKFSEEQVAYALRQADAGTAVGDVYRQLGISEFTRSGGCRSSRTRMPGSSGWSPILRSCRLCGAKQHNLRLSRRQCGARCGVRIVCGHTR
jgi:hypothetical protein